MMARSEIIYGYPGTGKTYTLIERIAQLLKEGVAPSEICFCTFTKSAAEELKARAARRFGLQKEDMPYFGTIHSICFREFCWDKNLLNSRHAAEFFARHRISYEVSATDTDYLQDDSSGKSAGNVLLNFYTLLRTVRCKGVSQLGSAEELKKEFHRMKVGKEFFMPIFANTFDPYEVLKDFERFKYERNLIDYSDMLLRVVERKWVVPTRALLVDEAQDMSPIQWEIFRLWSENKQAVILSGDDDQTLYSFLGASPHHIIDFQKSADEVTILSTTFRLGATIHEHCKRFIDRNIASAHRVKKEVVAARPGGHVEEHWVDDDLARTLQFIRPNQDTFVLFRTNYYKQRFVRDVLIPRGIIHDEIRGTGIWNPRTVNLFNAIIKLEAKQPLSPIEVEFLVESIATEFKLLRRGLKSDFKTLAKKPEYRIGDLVGLGFGLNLFEYLKDMRMLRVLRVNDEIKQAFEAAPKRVIEPPVRLKVGTIHAAKGREADAVILFKDVSRRVAQEARSDLQAWENEMRVVHVGQTRARDNLTILRGGFERSEASLIP